MKTENEITLKWDDSYSIDIEEIDHQHKYFFLLIGRLNELKENKEKEKLIPGVIDELVKYAVFHFKSEENLMAYNGYPALNGHKILHINLIEELSNNRLKYENDFISLDEFIKFIFKWLVTHTTKEDIKFGDFIRRSDTCSG
jgi:hemerythrin-like metal-binding protein